LAAAAVSAARGPLRELAAQTLGVAGE